MVSVPPEMRPEVFRGAVPAGSVVDGSVLLPQAPTRCLHLPVLEPFTKTSIHRHLVQVGKLRHRGFTSHQVFWGRNRAGPACSFSYCPTQSAFSVLGSCKKTKVVRGLAGYDCDSKPPSLKTSPSSLCLQGVLQVFSKKIYLCLMSCQQALSLERSTSWVLLPVTA